MKKFLLFATIIMCTHIAKAQPLLLPTEDPSGFANLGGLTYFINYVPGVGYELYKTDGTTGGTVLVKDINPGIGSSLYGSVLRVFNNTLYFFATDGTTGNELWKSDGTGPGTVMVKDIYPGTANSTTTFALTATNHALYFFARDSAGAAHYGLWVSDGTSGGTTMLATATSTHSEIFADDTLVYFDANLGGTGDELCVTNGTIAGTQMVANINTGTASSSPHNFAKLGSHIIFSATGVNGMELYTTDGTTPGTVELKDINAYGDSKPYGFGPFNGQLLFFASDSTHGYEPWLTDGTPSGTQMLKDIVAGAGSSGSSTNGTQSARFISLGSLAFFSAGGHWLTDGTAGGTNQFLTTYTASGNNYVVHNNRVYFTPRSPGGLDGQDVWSTTNGTDAIQHTFVGTPPSTMPGLFLGYNVMYVVYKNALQVRVLFSLSLGTCSPAIAIQGNLTLTCNQHLTQLTADSTFSGYYWSNGDTTRSVNVLSPGTYFVSATDPSRGCFTADTVTVALATSVITQQLCGVSVDSATGKNMLVWNKHNANISETFFRIEKETGINQFALVADVPYDSLSAYVDTSSNPLANSSAYRIRVVDSCGNVSAPSTVHKTIHLSQNVGINGVVNLSWNVYEGTTYAQVNVLRSLNGAGWSNLSVLSGSSTSYTDLAPPTGTLNYLIEVLIDSTCSPSRSLNSILSNRVSLISTSISSLSAQDDFVIAPNPATNELNVRINSNRNFNFNIYNSLGQLVKSGVLETNATTIYISEWINGIYTIELSGDSIKERKRFIVQK